MRARELLQYRKDPRFVVSAPLFLVAITSLIYYLVQRAEELSPEALTSRILLFALWNVNLILVVGILFVLLRVVIKLLLERQKGILGSRFRTKLVATYVVTSIVPIVLLFFIASELMRASIDRWFNTPVRTILQNSDQIAQSAQQRALVDAQKAAEEIGAAADGSSTDQILDHVRRFHPVDLVGIYEDRTMLRLVANPKTPVHQIGEPSARFFDEIASNGYSQKIDVVTSGKWLRSGVRIGENSNRVAIAGVFLPDTISRMIDENLIAHQRFQQLDSQREALKASRTLLFLAVTLSFLFGALWVAVYVSRRITVPIQALAEGTQALASGGYGHRVDVHATDEFGLLIDSFNAMSEQLADQRSALTGANSELQGLNRRVDEERAFLSTVLESVSTGIVTLNDRMEIRAINRAALDMLEIPEPAELTSATAIFKNELKPLGSFLAELSSRDPRSRELTLIRGGEIRYLEVSAARLKGRNEEGWVVAIEDSTQLVQAQKLAAWSEAARRIAHEIKNPLTPIQLSAERIARKAQSPDADFSRVVEEGCRTIVTEVGQLKRLVDEFSRFARMPAIHLQRSSVAQLLEDVASLYREIKPAVRVVAQVDPSIEAVIDSAQIRRALINLLDNAIEATDAGEITLSARRLDRRLIFEVSDTGRGVPDSDKERLFLPYFSTKERGTGLGLAIVHRIVHDHDGKISVHDNVPKGTRFEIEIPA